MRFFRRSIFKFVTITIILFGFGGCAYNPPKSRKPIKAPDYLYSTTTTSASKITRKMTISLLPVSDCRNVPPNYWGRGQVAHYFTEPVSQIVRKAVRSELISEGYDVLLDGGRESKSFYKNLIYLNVEITDFFGEWLPESFHIESPFSITLKARLIDDGGNVFARNQFVYNTKRKRANVGVTTYSVQEYADYLITHALPIVLNEMMVWLNGNLSGEKKEVDGKQIDADMTIKKLEQLKEMRERGLITEEEYQGRKRNILKTF